MATSRTRAPRAPIEGQTREVRTREKHKVFGNFSVVGPQVVASEMFHDGQWLRTATVRASVQRLVVGSMVRITRSNTRRSSRLACPRSEADRLNGYTNASHVHHNVAADGVSAQLVVRSPGRWDFQLGVVTEISGSVHVVQPIKVPSSYLDLRFDPSGGCTVNARSYFNDNSGGADPYHAATWEEANHSPVPLMVVSKSHLTPISFTNSTFTATLARVLRVPMTKQQMDARRAASTARLVAGRTWRWRASNLDRYKLLRKAYDSIAQQVREVCSKANPMAMEYSGLRTNLVHRATYEQLRYTPERTAVLASIDERIIPALLRRHERKFGERMTFAAGCQHIHMGQSVPLAINISPLAHADFCPHCVSSYGRPAHDSGGDPTGVMIHTQRVSAYEWADGLYRTFREPAIIGSYHSGKNIVGYVPPITQDKSGPTIGIELEVQGTGRTQLEPLARELRSRLAPHLPDNQLRRYMHFEYDGSVSGGFEIVTGWTNHATQALLLNKLLVDADGSMPFAGRLRSHDASCSCGLHVHLEKPKSLIHAAKLRYVMNGRQFEPMVKAVARRYNEQYCRVNGANTEGPLKDASDHRKRAKQQIGTWRGEAAVTRSSIHSLSASRYEITNFTSDKTVEIRVFKGSMKYATVMACIEMALAAWRYAKEIPAAQMSPTNFAAFISRAEWASETRFLRLMLKAKGFAVRVPNVNKRVHSQELAADAE